MKNEANEKYTCRLKFTAILFTFTKLQSHPRAHHQINIYYIYNKWILYIVYNRGFIYTVLHKHRYKVLFIHKRKKLCHL